MRPTNFTINLRCHLGKSRDKIVEAREEGEILEMEDTHSLLVAEEEEGN